jgi:hypothetical protein
MRKLIYGIAPAIEIEDRGLRHLQVAIMTKLRRDERFTFSWATKHSSERAWHSRRGEIRHCVAVQRRISLLQLRRIPRRTPEQGVGRNTAGDREPHRGPATHSGTRRSP